MSHDDDGTYSVVQREKLEFVSPELKTGTTGWNTS